MPCIGVRGIGIVCTGRQRRQRCKLCDGWAVALCDGCDLRICNRHRVNVAAGVDYCPGCELISDVREERLELR